jgi:hypothetical protein
MISIWKNIDANEAEVRSRGLRRRLADLDQALQAQQAILRDNPDSFAFKLSCNSLIQIQGRLRSELYSLLSHRSNEQISFALGGRKFANHSASMGYLGIFLIRLQKLYTSIAQAIQTGPTRRGRIALELQQATELRLADVFPSSFGMKVCVESGFNLLGQSVASESLEHMFQLLKSSENEQLLMRFSGELGRRTCNHLNHLATLLQSEEATLKIDWIDYTGTQNNWISTPEKISRIINQINKITEIKSEEKELVGRLVGASLLRNRFEFLLADRKTIEGKFVSGLSSEITDAFGSICTVTVDETEIYDTVSGERQTYYSLTAIQKDELCEQV